MSPSRPFRSYDRRAALAATLLLGAISALLFVPGIARAQAVASTPAGGSAEGLDEMTDLSLRELLDVQIFTVSRAVDSVHKTPAIISVVTAQEIADMGAETLYDVLNTIPGIEVVERTTGAYQVIFRGVINSGENNNSLLLLNGHPLREFESGSYLLESIPVLSIKQLEIVRGPGSVQYGSNGFAGVINVITKSGKDANANSIYAQYGRFNTADVNASVGVSDGELSTFVAAQHRGGDGFPITVPDTQGNLRSLRDRDNYDSAYVKLNWKDWEAAGHYFVANKSSAGFGFAGFDPFGVRFTQETAADLRYHHDFSEKVGLVASLFYDAWHKRLDIASVDFAGGDVPLLTGDAYSGARYGAEARVNWQALNWAKLSGGLNFDTDVEDQAQALHPDVAPVRIPHETESDAAAFLETSLNPTDKLGLNIGVRLDQNSKSGAVVVPRASVVYSFTPSISAKLLYGRAYRNPNFTERYQAFEGGDTQPYASTYPFDPVGPPTVLQPEKIDTFDLGVDWKLGKQALRVNAFYLHTGDIIEHSQVGYFLEPVAPVPIPFARYGNNTAYSVAGTEAEFRSYPTETLSYFLNVSLKYAYSGSLSNAQKLPWRSPVLANLGFTYAPKWTKFKLTTYATLTGARTGPADSSRDLAAFPDATVSSSAYLVWNAHLGYSLTSNVEVSLLLHNILNSHYGYADYVQAVGPQVPGAPFTAYGRLTARF